MDTSGSEPNYCIVTTDGKENIYDISRGEVVLEEWAQKISFTGTAGWYNVSQDSEHYKVWSVSDGKAVIDLADYGFITQSRRPYVYIAEKGPAASWRRKKIVLGLMQSTQDGSFSLTRLTPWCDLIGQRPNESENIFYCDGFIFDIETGTTISKTKLQKQLDLFVPYSPKAKEV